MRPNVLIGKALAAGWPVPTRPPLNSPINDFRDWHRLYSRLRWVVTKSDQVSNHRPGAKFARLRLAAKQRHLDVTLSLQEYTELVADGVCHYCGARLPETGHGVDRKDCLRGYTRSNVVLACDACNRIKGDIFTFDQMVEIGNLLRVWRSEGRWSDPTRKDRRDFGGRPPKGDLRREIVEWNKRWLAPGEASLDLSWGSGRGEGGSGKVRESCGSYAVETGDSELADELHGIRAASVTAPRRQRLSADGANVSSAVRRDCLKPRPLLESVEQLEERDPFPMLRRLALTGREHWKPRFREGSTVPATIVRDSPADYRLI